MEITKEERGKLPVWFRQEKKKKKKEEGKKKS